MGVGLSSVNWKGQHEGADLTSDLLPLGEKVEVREAREAGKDKAKKGGEKKAKRIKNRQRNRRLKKKGKTGKKTNLKKNKLRKNKKTTDKRKKNKPKKEDKERRKKKKLLKKKKPKKNGRQGPAGGDWSSCGTSGVNDTCLLNAVNALNFEKNQIQNFFKQKARLENQNKVTGKKKGKKGV